jgi:MFS family permease
LSICQRQVGSSGGQIYTLPGYGSAFIMMLLCAYLSDKTGRRGPFVIFGFALMTIGCAMVAAISPTLEVSRRNGRFAGLTLVSIGSLIIIPLNQ